MESPKNKGFEISFDALRRILWIRAWGLWDVELGKKYDRAFAEKVTECCTDGHVWYVLMDLAGFYPYAPEVQHILRQHVAMAAKHGMRKLVYLGEMSVSQLHLRPLLLTSDLPQYAFVETEEEALQWLLQ